MLSRELLTNSEATQVLDEDDTIIPGLPESMDEVQEDNLEQDEHSIEDEVANPEHTEAAENQTDEDESQQPVVMASFLNPFRRRRRPRGSF